MALRRPDNEYRNTNPYLSPGLHNVPDTWVRYLRSKSLQFLDEFGEAKNHRLLMGKSVQERISIHKWAESVKSYARDFTLAIYDDELVLKKKALLEERHPFTSDDGAWQDEEVEEYENEAPHPKLHRSTSSSSLSTSASTQCDSVFDKNDDNSSSDENTNSSWDDDLSDYGHGVYCHGALIEGDEFQIALAGPSAVRFSLDDEDDDASDYDGDGAYMQSDADLSSPIEDIKHSPARDRMSSELFEEEEEADHTPPASAREIELKYLEMARQERISEAEDQLASAWYNWSGSGYANKCSWILIESQTPRSLMKEVALQSPILIIQVTTPEGAVCDIIERQAWLPADHHEHVAERNAAQDKMTLDLKKLRARYETYSEYVRRLDAEAWWAEREDQTKKEMVEMKIVT
jgi:hypothetical protein